jgi:hypothetical protein
MHVDCGESAAEGAGPPADREPPARDATLPSRVDERMPSHLDDHAVTTPGTRVSRATSLDVLRLRADGRRPEGLAQQAEEEFRRIKWPVLNAITGATASRPR